MADPLAEINGIKPNVLLKDGENREVSSMTSNSVYKVKRTMDHYYCTCPAWRNQSKFPINARTCKHIKSLLGDAYEAARLKRANPDGGGSSSGAKKPSSKSKRKRDEQDEDEEKPRSKKARKPASKANDADAGEGEETDGETSEGDRVDTGKKKVPELLLAVKWDEAGQDPTGWWVSEKLDGVRTYFDGKTFYSRLGNTFTPPEWFFKDLPKNVTLDGELFGGRGKFQDTVSIVKTINSPHWQNITFQIFDVPYLGAKPFEERLEYLRKTFGPGGPHVAPHIVVVDQIQAKNKEHVLQRLREVENLGGEGVMLRKPQSPYEGRRSNSLLKVKTFYDAEAIVTGYVPGKGKNKGSMGALKCKMASGKTFNIGTGFSDKQRQNPPKVGSIVVYRFQELTRDSVPRFPSFVGEAADKTEPKDAEIPEQRKANLDDA